jgi:thioredoxin-related protein
MTKFLLLFILPLYLYANDINFDTIVKQSSKQNKQVMVFFHMEHCPWCHKMIDVSLSKQDVQDTINKYFTYIDVDIETSGNILYKNQTYSKRDFAREFNIYFYPTTLMFDDGIVIKNINGYRNKNKFTNLIKYIGTKSYKDMTIKEFIANEDFNND